MKVTWDHAKNLANQKNHGVSFEEARELFTSGIDCYEIFDEAHSEVKDRVISIGPIERGMVLVVWTERDDDVAESSAHAGQRDVSKRSTANTLEEQMDDIPELTSAQFASAISAKLRKRLIRGKFESGADVAALRKFVRLTQAEFARAMGISVHTLRNWEQGRRTPEGPAIALLRIAARHPRILRENLRSAA